MFPHETPLWLVASQANVSLMARGIDQWTRRVIDRWLSKVLDKVCDALDVARRYKDRFSLDVIGYTRGHDMNGGEGGGTNISWSTRHRTWRSFFSLHFQKHCWRCSVITGQVKVYVGGSSVLCSICSSCVSFKFITTIFVGFNYRTNTITKNSRTRV